MRYMLIADNIPTDCKVIDLGCGTGILSEYIPNDYLGIDVMQEYIDHCRLTYKSDAKRNYCFVCKGIDRFLENGKPIPNSVFVSIGTYTLNLDNLIKEDYLSKFNDEIGQVLKLGNKLILNGFHTAVDFQDPKIYYHDLKDLMLLAKQYNRKLTINNYVSPYEFIAVFE